MLDKLNEVENRFEKVNELLCLPETVSDIEKYTSLMREMKTLEPVVNAFRDYKAVPRDYSKDGQTESKR